MAKVLYMKIVAGHKYTALKDLNNPRKGRSFTKGKTYTAEKNDALRGDDGESYGFPPHSRLLDFFKEE